jgi:flagellar motor component MotA
MEIICEKCNTRLNIPDEKIPKGQQATVSCPKCKNKIPLNVPVPVRKNSPSEVEEKPRPGVNNADSDYGYEDDDASLDFFEEGIRLALIMGNEPHQAEKLGKTVDELGYKHVLAKNTRDAISKMRLHHFDVILLSDGFDGIDLAQSPILQHINNLSMSVRRRIFLALIADKFKTMDHMMAFAMSANMVINGGDLDRLTSIMQHAIADNEKFYKVFTDTMVEVGKA